MSLRQIVSWVFTCDHCGREATVSDGDWDGRPRDWFGPRRDDGFHTCSDCHKSWPASVATAQERALPRRRAPSSGESSNG